MRTGSDSFLNLHEEIMLLALRDREGTIVSGTHYRFAIGAALLAELLMENRIALETVKKKNFVVVADSQSTGNDLLDECLERIRDSKRRQTLQTWVSRFANMKNLKNRVAEQLCRRGILREREDKILLIFTRKIFPEMDPGPEKRLIQRLRKAIFTATKDIDPRTVVLISLANTAGLLKVTFDKKRLKERKERIERIVNGEITGKAAKAAIEAMQAAVMVAVIVPTIAATST
jgi:hypothetical protein